MILPRRSTAICLLLSLTFLLFFFYPLKSKYPPSSDQRNSNHIPPTGDDVKIDVPSKQEMPSKAIVMAKVTTDDDVWVRESLSDWSLFAYETDNPNAQLTVPINKGRESMAYLSFIIDHYNNLPDVMVFIHAHRYQWHNDDPLYDQVQVLKRLQLSHVERSGYVNLRCTYSIGCPSEINNTHVGDLADSAHPAEAQYSIGYRELFKLEEDAPVPELIGVSCCAQFAVTRQTVHKRSRAEYEHYRTWLHHTTMSDDTSGRVMEYTWHIIMGKDSVFCPNAKQCYCDTFGVCDLDCPDVGNCRFTNTGQPLYKLPRVASMPPGWPIVSEEARIEFQG